jgi:hypothetical protein
MEHVFSRVGNRASRQSGGGTSHLNRVQSESNQYAGEVYCQEGEAPSHCLRRHQRGPVRREQLAQVYQAGKGRWLIRQVW